VHQIHSSRIHAEVKETNPVKNQPRSNQRDWRIIEGKKCNQATKLKPKLLLQDNSLNIHLSDTSWWKPTCFKAFEMNFQQSSILDLTNYPIHNKGAWSETDTVLISTDTLLWTHLDSANYPIHNKGFWFRTSAILWSYLEASQIRKQLERCLSPDKCNLVITAR